VDTESTRDSTGGEGREGEGGREGDRVIGDRETVSLRRGGMATDSARGGGGGTANVSSEVASLRASSNGLTSLLSTTVLTGSTSVPRIWTAESGASGGCGGCGVTVPEGTGGIGDCDGNGDDDGNGDEGCSCSCQYMGSSSCSSSSASNPCRFRAVAARASAKNSALTAKRRLAEGNLEGVALADDGWPRGSSDAGTLTKAPKSESVELAEVIEPTGGQAERVNMDEDPNGRGDAGGVAGEMSVAKRSSMSGLVGGVEERMGVPLPAAGRGIRGGMDRRGGGISYYYYFWFLEAKKLGKGKGRLELGMGGEQCGHREVNGDGRQRTFRPSNGKPKSQMKRGQSRWGSTGTERVAVMGAGQPRGGEREGGAVILGWTCRRSTRCGTR
jgi:hypothetical protein